MTAVFSPSLGTIVFRLFPLLISLASRGNARTHFPSFCTKHVRARLDTSSYFRTPTQFSFRSHYIFPGLTAPHCCMHQAFFIKRKKCRQRKASAPRSTSRVQMKYVGFHATSTKEQLVFDRLTSTAAGIQQQLY
jgi:hypothetical protein